MLYRAVAQSVDLQFLPFNAAELGEYQSLVFFFSLLFQLNLITT